MVMFSRKCIIEDIRRPVPKYFGRVNPFYHLGGFEVGSNTLKWHFSGYYEKTKRRIKMPYPDSGAGFKVSTKTVADRPEV